MLVLKAHFDGRVIVPDEPVNLPTNQKLIVQLEAVKPEQTQLRDLVGLGNVGPSNENPRFKSHDELWEK